ncbi:MAG TPA: aromatic acid exporter family protein [Jatrophihabitans sp.]|nr:aromatic acid exporter family protein [Jatrophihabitans sp.]
MKVARLRPTLTMWRGGLRERGPASLARAARLSAAAMASYGAASASVADPRPVTAALTALLVVQVTLVGTLADTARRVLSVVVGVGVAITVSTFVGFTWWSLGGLVAVSILLGQALRLGPHLMEVPISAMLILAAGGAGTQATDRVAETLIGAAVGVLVNVAAPPRTRTRSAGAAVEDYAHRMANLLERMSQALAEGPVSRDQAFGWLQELRNLAGGTAAVDRALIEAEQSRKLNPRAVGSTDPIPDLRNGLDALEHTAVSLRSVLRSIAEGAAGATSTDDDDQREEPRIALSALLAELARCIAEFGTLVRVEDEGGPHSDALRQALDSARRAAQQLADRLRAEMDDSESWQLSGAVLAGVERALDELDADALVQTRQERRRQAAAFARPSTMAARRIRASARRAIAENPTLARRRRRR